MEPAALGEMKEIDKLAAGGWFVFSTSRGKHLAFTLRQDPADADFFRHVELLSYSRKLKLEARLRAVRRINMVSHVFELAKVEIDFPEGLSWLNPAPQGISCPGALVIKGSDFGMLVQDKEDRVQLVSLADGSVSWPTAEEMALVTSWRLVRRFGDKVREVCAVSVEP
jgi:hypothetical protein